MPGDGESSRYHLRGPVKPPSRYADSGDEGQEATRMLSSKPKRYCIFFREHLLISNFLLIICTSSSRTVSSHLEVSIPLCYIWLFFLYYKKVFFASMCFSKRLSPLKRCGRVLKAESDTDSNISSGTSNRVFTKSSEVSFIICKQKHAKVSKIVISFQSPKKTLNNGTQRDISRENATTRTARPHPSEISPTMRENLRHLKNVLKLPKVIYSIEWRESCSKFSWIILLQIGQNYLLWQIKLCEVSIFLNDSGYK